MRASQWFLKTLKEVPKDADIISHQLMLRAGMIRQLGSGLYTWLPLGLKVLKKVETIVREEMNKAGALEVLMPAVQPAELWQETGRWDTFGNLLLTFTDNKSRDYCYGPTHEEVVTALFRDVISSYQELPFTLYQIQTKFRDEIRPRFGVMRAREFIMKDAYSFHLTTESLEATYADMYEAYTRIFTRMGLTFRAVEADTGAIGGQASHEFQLLAETGEDVIFYSDTGSYAANSEQATNFIEQPSTVILDKPLTRVDTPQAKTVDEVAVALNIPTDKILKTLIVKGRTHPMVAIVLRGNDTLNPIKAQKHPLIASPLTLIDEAQTLASLSIPFGSIGPIGLSIPIILDYACATLESFACGANIPGQHYINGCYARDLSHMETADFRQVAVGDKSPDGQGHLLSCRGIEVGHIFQLGNKYTESMHAAVLTEKGEKKAPLMGCYGIGVSRIVAAAIEQHHDAQGIIWPKALAPFDVVIVPINMHRSSRVKAVAEVLYHRLLSENMDVLLDDRNERPGVLFADQDLIGIPHRIVISERLLDAGVIEYKNRQQGEPLLLKDDELLIKIKES